MGKEKNISARIDADLHSKVEEYAENKNKSISDVLRDVLQTEFSDDAVPVDILGEFFSDLQEIRLHAPDDDTHHRSVYEAIKEDTLQHISHSTLQEPVREALVDAETVYIAGHGSSLSVGHWFENRVQRDGVQPLSQTGTAIHETDFTTKVGTGEEILGESIQPDDVVVCISQSGRTNTLLELAESVPRRTTILAVTQSGRPLAEEADYTLFTPHIEEHLTEYATKTLIAQVATLQLLVFDGASERDKLGFKRRFQALDAFLDSQFEPDGSFRKESQFAALADKIEENDDLGLDPLVASMGSGYAYGHEAQLKFVELLHSNASFDHLASVRDKLINVLCREDGYLLTMLPRPGTDSNTAGGEVKDPTPHERCHQYLFENDDAIETQLRRAQFPRKSVGFPLIAFGFADNRDCIAQRVMNSSAYRNEGHLRLNPAGHDCFPDGTSTRDLSDSVLDLYMFTAIFVLTYALLKKQWKRDRTLQKTIIQRVYDTDIDAVSGGESQ